MSFSRSSTPSRTTPLTTANYTTPSTTNIRIKSSIRPSTTTSIPRFSSASSLTPKSAYKELDQYIQRYEETAVLSQGGEHSLADIKLHHQHHHVTNSSSSSSSRVRRSATRSKSPTVIHQMPPTRMEQPHHPLAHTSREAFHLHQHEYTQLKHSPTSITESFTPYRGVNAYESIENSMQHFLSSLEKHRTHRSHQLRQIQQFLQSDLDWENEFGESMIQANMKKHELTDEEFQAYLLGELPMDGVLAETAAGEGVATAARGEDDISGIAPQPSHQEANNSTHQSVDIDEVMELNIQRNDKKTHLRLITRNIGDLLQQMSEAQSSATLIPVVSDYAKESIQSIGAFHRHSLENNLHSHHMQDHLRQTPTKVSWDEYNLAQSSKKENLPFNRITTASATSITTAAVGAKRWEDIGSEDMFPTRLPPPAPLMTKSDKEMLPLRPKLTPSKEQSRATRYATSDSDSESSRYAHRASQDPMKKYLQVSSKESRDWLASHQISKIEKMSEEDDDLDLFSIAKGGLELAYDVDFTLGSKTPEPKTPKVQPKFT